MYRKFKNKRTKIDNYYFASRLEADLYIYLKQLERQNIVRDIECQVQVYLTKAKILYKPDFRAFDIQQGVEVYYEAKGCETATWRLKRRLWMHYGPGELQVWKRSGKDAIRLAESLNAK